MGIKGGAMLLFMLLISLSTSRVVLSGSSASSNGGDSHELYAIWKKGEKAFNQGEFAAAAFEFEKVAKQAPHVKQVLENLAIAHSRSGNYEKAFKTYRKGLKRFNEDPALHLNMCRDFGMVLNSRTATYRAPTSEIIEVCERAMFLNPGNAEATSTYSAVLMLLNRFDDAKKVMESAIEGAELNDSVTKTIMGNLALTNLRGGDYKNAWKLTKKLLKIDGPNQKTLSSAAGVRVIGWPLDKKAWDYQARSLHLLAKELDIKDASCPSGNWKMVFNYTEEAEQHPDLVQLTPLNSDGAYHPYGREDDPIFVGEPLPKYPKFYHERYIHLVHLDDAYMMGNSGTLSAACRVFTGGHHCSADLQSYPRSSTSFSTIEIDEVVATIVQHNTANYYHWCAEALPRLLWLNATVFADPANAHVKLLVPPANQRHVRETLELNELQHLSSRLMTYTDIPDRTRLHLSRGVYTVDWVHPKDDVFGSLEGNSWGVYSPPKRSLELARDFFHDVLRNRRRMPELMKSDTDKQHRIVYVSRPHGHAVRTIPNEEVLIDALRKEFGKNTVRVHTGAEPLLDQVEMFARARVVVGAHGAGLTNLLWCQPGAHLVMLPMDPHVEFCFGHLATALDHTHTVITSVPGSYYYSNYGPLTIEHVHSIVNAVANAFEKAPNSGGSCSLNDMATQAENAVRPHEDL